MSDTNTATESDSHATYTYSIYDANPASSSVDAWPAHGGVEIDADSIEDAIDQVRDIIEAEAAGLNPSDGYEVGQRIYAQIEDARGIIVGTPTHDLTAEDLGVDEDEDAVECAICAGYGTTTRIALDDAIEIEHDAERDGLERRRVYACDDCAAVFELAN